MEGVSQKIRRQIEELERISGVESNALTVDGVPVDSYLTRYLFFFFFYIHKELIGDLVVTCDVKNETFFF